MVYRLEKRSEEDVIVVRGTLCMENISKLRNSLFETLQKVDHVIFETESLDNINFGCIQLLCSACRTATLRKKQFSIVSPQIELLRKRLVEAGYSKTGADCSVRNSACIIDGIIKSNISGIESLNSH